MTTSHCGACSSEVPTISSEEPTTLPAKNLLQMSNVKFPWRSFIPFPHTLLVTRGRRSAASSTALPEEPVDWGEVPSQMDLQAFLSRLNKQVTSDTPPSLALETFHHLGCPSLDMLYKLMLPLQRSTGTAQGTEGVAAPAQSRTIPSLKWLLMLGLMHHRTWLTYSACHQPKPPVQF